MKEQLNKKGPSARELIAANVRKLRTDLGTSQEALGVSAGLHRTYVSQLERCTANITVDGLDRIAEALGVPVRRLLDPE